MQLITIEQLHPIRDGIIQRKEEVAERKEKNKTWRFFMMFIQS